MHPEIASELGIREGDLIANKYRVHRILGVGGMGVVVAANHLRLDELVAIKLLLPEALADADAVQRFEREARAAVKIKSEHVARIIDVGTLDSGAPFMVMQHLEGEDLADRIERAGPLPVQDAVELLLQACEAVAEAHALGIVHRDLKPSNLFCVEGSDGRPSIKVLDFGISKVTRPGAAISGLGMTKTRTMMGSPYYMSPEQMESPRTVDARTDIWSLGVVLYQLLAGEVPFDGETLPQVCVSVATRPAPPLRRRRPDVPSGLEAIALCCLEKDASKRFPSVAALATALARFGPRRAQVSLERILRTAQQSERPPDDTGPTHERTTTRPVTGSFASRRPTATPQDGHIRSIIGWLTAVAVVTAVGFTFAYRQFPTSPSASPAVLVTPPVQAEQRATATEPPSPSSVAAPTAMAPAATVLLLNPVTAVPSRASSAPTAAARAAPRSVAPMAPIMDTEANPYASPETTPSTVALSSCVLNLSSMPPARVMLDGMPVGFAAKISVTVVTGEHQVVFRWRGGDKQTTVTCSAGETKTIIGRFDETPPGNELPEQNPYR